MNASLSASRFIATGSGNVRVPLGVYCIPLRLLVSTRYVLMVGNELELGSVGTVQLTGRTNSYCCCTSTGSPSLVYTGWALVCMALQEIAAVCLWLVCDPIVVRS